LTIWSTFTPRDDTPTSLDLSPGLGTLQHLQQLCLPIIASIPSNFAALPASLTALHLEGVDPLFNPNPVDECCLSLQTVPQLTGLAALQKLELKWFAVDPTSLPCFTQLRHLSLEHCTPKFMLWPDHHDEFWGGSYSTPFNGGGSLVPPDAFAELDAGHRPRRELSGHRCRVGRAVASSHGIQPAHKAGAVSPQYTW
jgi:hypothetical protein